MDQDTSAAQVLPSRSADPTGDQRRPAFRPSFYLAVVLAAVIAASAYSLRINGIFGCQASGYSAGRYLAYCNTEHFGDYDHGAFWFGLEPQAVAAATAADVLFIGNSRMQFGLSTATIEDHFKASGIASYLLGFAQYANYLFEGPLLSKLQPKASVYAINLDRFFDDYESAPVRAVMRDGTARARYENRRSWQSPHAVLCRRIVRLCGNEIAFFRAPESGAWTIAGRGFRRKPVSYDPLPDPKVVATYVQRGREFVASLPVRRGCVILTTIPTVGTGMGTAKAIAEGLGLPLVAPELPGLDTFDESHLDPPSAERWSAAFIEAAGAMIRQCVDDARAGRAQPGLR